MLFFKKLYKNLLNDEWIVLPFSVCVSSKKNNNLKQYKETIRESCYDYFNNLIEDVKVKILQSRHDSFVRKLIFKEIIDENYKTWNIVIKQIARYNNIINDKNINIDNSNIFDDNILSILMYSSDISQKVGLNKEILTDIIVTLFNAFVSKLSCIINRQLTIMETIIIMNMVLELRKNITEKWFNNIIIEPRQKPAHRDSVAITNLKEQLLKENYTKTKITEIMPHDKFVNLSKKLEKLLFTKNGI